MSGHINRRDALAALASIGTASIGTASMGTAAVGTVGMALQGAAAEPAKDDAAWKIEKGRIRQSVVHWS